MNFLIITQYDGNKLAVKPPDLAIIFCYQGFQQIRRK